MASWSDHSKRSQRGQTARSIRREALRWGKVLGRVAWDWAQEQPVVQRQRQRVEEKVAEFRGRAQARFAQLEDEFWEWVKQLDEEGYVSAPARSGPSLSECYDLLSVSPSASDAEVRKAWRALMLKCHPDRFANDPEEEARAAREARQVNEAYQVICRVRGL
jgi:DnaJ-domain-containing protein 1